MPNMWPALSTSIAESSARWDADPPPRRMGIWPTARKIHAVLGSSKYSALATNVIRRRRTSGKNTESQNDTWLLARIAGPAVGTNSAPSTRTRKKKRRIGVRIVFITQYAMAGDRSGGLVRVS